MNFWTLVFLFGFGLGSAHSQQFFEGWVLGNFPVLSRLEEFPALTQDWDRTRTVLSSFFRNDPFLSQRPDVWIRYEGGGARGEMILVPFLTLLTQDGEALAQFFQGKDLFSPEQEVLAQVKARALGAYDQLTADLAFAESADRPEIQQGRQGVAQLGNPSPDFDGSGEGSEETFHPGHVGLGFLFGNTHSNGQDAKTGTLFIEAPLPLWPKMEKTGHLSLRANLPIGWKRYFPKLGASYGVVSETLEREIVEGSPSDRFLGGRYVERAVHRISPGRRIQNFFDLSYVSPPFGSFLPLPKGIFNRVRLEGGLGLTRYTEDSRISTIESVSEYRWHEVDCFFHPQSTVCNGRTTGTIGQWDLYRTLSSTLLDEVPGPVRNNWIKNAHLAARVALIPFTGEGGLGIDLLGRYRRTLTSDPALKAQTFEGGIVLIF